MRFVSEIAANLVFIAKQGHTFVSSSGTRTFVELIQTTQNETNEFVSIPGSQPVINWQALTATTATPITGSHNQQPQTAMLNMQQAATATPCLFPHPITMQPIMLSMGLPINAQQMPTLPTTMTTRKSGGGGLRIINPASRSAITTTPAVYSNQAGSDNGEFSSKSRVFYFILLLWCSKI